MILDRPDDRVRDAGVDLVDVRGLVVGLLDVVVPDYMRLARAGVERLELAAGHQAAWSGCVS
jgi:hypothetical protein